MTRKSILNYACWMLSTPASYMHAGPCPEPSFRRQVNRVTADVTSAGEAAWCHPSGRWLLHAVAAEFSLLECALEASGSCVQRLDMGQQNNPCWRWSGAEAV